MYNALQIVLILLATAVLAVVVFRLLRLPPMLGYLLSGIVIGPHALGWIPESGGNPSAGYIWRRVSNVQYRSRI